MDMVYYKVMSNSIASKILEARFTAMTRQREIATAIGKEWLKTDGFHLVGQDATIVGYSPDGTSWQQFMKALPDRKIWTRHEDKRAQWIAPRMVRGNKDLVMAWGAIPAIENWAATTRKLFGAGRFIDNSSLHMHGATLWSHEGTTLLGVPWLAAVGVMAPFDGEDAAFKLAAGLQRLPLDIAMSIMHKKALDAMKATKIKAELKA